PNIYVSGDGYWRTFGSAPGNYSNWFIQLTCGPGTCNGSTAAGAHVRDVAMTMSDDSPPSARLSEASELLGGELQRWVELCCPSGALRRTYRSAPSARARKFSVLLPAGEDALLADRVTDTSRRRVERAPHCVKGGVSGFGLAEVGAVGTDAEGRYRYGVARG